MRMTNPPPEGTMTGVTDPGSYHTPAGAIAAALNRRPRSRRLLPAALASVAALSLGILALPPRPPRPVSGSRRSTRISSAGSPGPVPMR